MLPEKLVVGGLANLYFVKELSSLVLNHKTPQSKRGVLNGFRGARYVGQTKIGAKLEHRIRGHLAASEEIIRPAFSHVAEIKTKFKSVTTVDPT